MLVLALRAQMLIWDVVLIGIMVVRDYMWISVSIAQMLISALICAQKPIGAQ